VGDKKTKTKTNMTTTPVVPGWVQQPMQDYTSAVSGMMGTNAQDFVAPASDLQNQAFEGAANLGAWQGNLNSAAGIYNNVAGAGANQIGQTHQATAAGILDNGWEQYANPFTDSVVDTTLQGFDQDAARQMAAMEAERARTGAFGGSRSAITQAMLAGEQGQNRASTEAQLRAQAYREAMGLAGSDADRRQQTGLFNTGALNTTEGLNLQARDAYANRQLSAASGLNNVANSEAANARGDVALQGDLGNVQREIDAAMRTADWSKLQAIGQLYGYANLPMFTGSNQKGTTTTRQSPSVLETIGQVAGTAASVAGLFSDRRLKKDVETVRLERGANGVRRRVRWRYRWENNTPKHEGYIAQELQQTDPHAVGSVLGYLTVNEAAL